MNIHVMLLAALTITVALAGCTSDEGPAETNSEGPDTDLGDRGAINGLIVDDNYRPVQLKEDWGSQGPGDYQDIGFILILETAQRYESNENGEFQILPLEPGTYTLRVAADNHEAIDKKVQVVAGEYTEVTVEARRTASTGGTVLSQEFVIFTACSADTAGIGAAGLFCGDASGDSQRTSFDTNYKDLAPDIRGMVTEMLATDEGYYGVAIRSHEKSCNDHSTLNGCLFDEPRVDGGDYVHSVLYPGMQKQVDGSVIEDGQEGYCTVDGLEDGTHEDCGRRFAIEFKNEFRTILFPAPSSRYYTDPVVKPFQDQYELIYVKGYTPAVGVILGVKAQFVQTVFLYDAPEGGIDDYCVLCENAAIPE